MDSKQNSPIVSIIVPIYNTADYLEQCLMSLKNQSMKDVEIILIDDGSDDGGEAGGRPKSRRKGGLTG